MSAQLHKYGARQPYRLTVAPGDTKPLLLNSDYAGPFNAVFHNKATTGAPTAVSVFLTDGGIEQPLGTVAPGEVAPVEFACAVRSIVVAQPADADDDIVVEVLQ